MLESIGGFVIVSVGVVSVLLWGAMLFGAMTDDRQRQRKAKKVDKA